MRRSALILAFILYSVISFAQDRGIQGPESDARAGIASPINDAWSSFNNPGALGHIESHSIALAYRNAYLIPELGTAGVSMQYKLKNSGIGLAYSRYGYENFSDSRINLSYGLLLNEEISLGVAFSPQLIRFPNIGTRFYPNASIGFMAKAADKINLAATLRNPINQQLDEYSNTFTETVLQVGASYQLIEEISLFGELEKNFDTPLRVKIAGEYIFQDKVYFRGGVITAPLEVSYGFGIRLKYFNLNLAMRQHNQLGLAGQLGIQFDIKTKVKDE